MTEVDTRSDGEKAVDVFLDSQDRTPLSSGSAVDAALSLVGQRVDIRTVASIDLANNPSLFRRALMGTFERHRAANVSELTTPKAVRDRLRDAYEINKWVAVRVAIAAALGQEVGGPVRAMAEDDPRLLEARDILATDEGRERALRVLRVVSAETRKEEDPTQPPLDEQYREAQKHKATRLFPPNETNLPNRELRRRQLMEHLRLRLADLAMRNSPHVQAVVKTFLTDELDPVSLRLSTPG